MEPEVSDEVSDEVSRAIAEARKAARAAGLAPDDPDDPEDAEAFEHSLRQGRQGRQGRGGMRLTSFTFHLEGLESAAHAGRVEGALNVLPGVQARVVYSTSMAWVTAPESLKPDVLRNVMTDAGVESWLTVASLRRRAERLARPRPASFYAHRHRENRARMALEGESFHQLGQGRRRHQVGTEVLYTSRNLITGARLLVALLFGLPVVVLQLVPSWQFDHWQWLCLGLATPVVLWSAWPFHRAMLGGLRRGMPALDAASSAAILLAYLYSLVELFTGPAGDPGWRAGNILISWGYQTDALFFDVACGCTILLLFGRLASRRTRLRSLLALNMLSVERGGDVTVVRKSRGGQPTKSVIPATEIRVGDDVLVGTGQVIPCDGEVVGGRSVVDAGPFSGGRGDVPVEVGATVFAGSTNSGDPLKVRVNRTGSRTRVAAVRRWIAAAEREENRLEQLATRTASLLVPWAAVIAVIAGIAWWTASSSMTAAVSTTLTVLVAVAPVALALSTTLALRLGLARAASDGMLLRDTGTVHRLAAVDTIIFNRAGTLTKGPMNVVGVTPAKGEVGELVLRVAGVLSLESPHGVSRAIVRADRESRDSGAGGADVPHWLEAGPVEVDGKGVFTATVDLPVADPQTGEKALRPVQAQLWRPRDLSELTDPTLANAVLSGGTPLVVSWRGRTRGVINVADAVKPDAESSVHWLEDAGVETYMLSRDTYPVARRMADSIGISKVLAGIIPSQKAPAVRNVHAHGATVAMVGDQDVLDCLEVADVGILMGSADRLDNIGGEHGEVRGLDSAGSDVVIIRDDVSVVAESVNLARHVRATVDWNLWLAWGYNILALVLAVSGLLNPLLATALMLGSSLLIEWRSARISHRDFSIGDPLGRDGAEVPGSNGDSRLARLRAWAGENLSPWQSR
ncbi:MAG: heavy metal translocating P-type ATPase [Corynebacterium sp.]|uniref:heavy metal translocating P-type ATPase n=1 Tax=Corynebacterium sp. TaxID=1720 RepID=UPI003F939205